VHCILRIVYSVCCMVQGEGCRVNGLGCMVYDVGCRVQGGGCMVQGKGCEVQPGPLEGGGGRDGHLKPSRPRLKPSRPNFCTGHVREPLRFPKNEMRCNLDLVKEAVSAHTRLTHRRTRLPPRQSVGGGQFIQHRHMCLFPRLQTTALRGN